MPDGRLINTITGHARVGCGEHNTRHAILSISYMTQDMRCSNQIDTWHTDNSTQDNAIHDRVIEGLSKDC